MNNLKSVSKKSGLVVGIIFTLCIIITCVIVANSTNSYKKTFWTVSFNGVTYTFTSDDLEEDTEVDKLVNDLIEQIQKDPETTIAVRCYLGILNPRTIKEEKVMLEKFKDLPENARNQQISDTIEAFLYKLNGGSVKKHY